MTFEEMAEAIAEAEMTIRRGDRHVAAMASLVRGRLRSGGVSTWVLEELKRELRDFNIHTGSWKERP